MRANSISLQKIFEQTIRYRIPLFQRPYVWNEADNWTPVWDDVRHLAEKKLRTGDSPPHFLGAVVLDQLRGDVGAVETRQVIDGQQRMTTLQLLLAALRDLALQHEARVTPLKYGNTRGTNVKDDPEWSAGDRYTTCSYRRAIARACDQAFPPPELLAKQENETDAQWHKRLTKEQKAELRAWQKAHRWHPHQLRHNAATELRREFGLEAARIILGHQSTAITEIYAEKDEQEAIAAIASVG